MIITEDLRLAGRVCSSPASLNQPPHPCQNVDLTTTCHINTVIQYAASRSKLPSVVYTTHLDIPPPHALKMPHCLAVPALVPTPHKCCCLCIQVESSLPHAVPKSVQQKQQVCSKVPLPSFAGNATSFQSCQASRQRSKPLIRAAARITGSLAEPLLRVSLLLQFGNAPAPGIDEPITDLRTSVSSLA